MCRELHEPVIFHVSISRKTKNAFQTIYFFQSFSTSFSTAFQDPRKLALKQAFCEIFCVLGQACIRGFIALNDKRTTFDCVFDFDI
jgi:hypothetical protein